MGVLFKAFHILNGNRVRTVAIKLISQELLLDGIKAAKARKQLVKEFLATSTLNHDNCVRAFDSAVITVTLFIVLMAFLNLEQLVKSNEQLSSETVLNIVWQAAHKVAGSTS